MANIDVLCIAAGDKTLDMKPVRLQRRPLGDNDVLIDMKFCGICHSDLHIARGDLALLGKPQYPFVPGHELSGIVSAVGSKVTKFKVGDQIGVGCMVRGGGWPPSRVFVHCVWWGGGGAPKPRPPPPTTTTPPKPRLPPRRWTRA